MEPGAQLIEWGGGLRWLTGEIDSLAIRSTAERLAWSGSWKLSPSALDALLLGLTPSVCRYCSGTY
jgi:hypothetical protein